jgi:hypothetical protein
VRELNPERHDFYKLLWHTDAAQTDAACLTAADTREFASSSLSSLGELPGGSPRSRTQTPPPETSRRGAWWCGPLPRVVAESGKRLICVQFLILYALGLMLLEDSVYS